MPDSIVMELGTYIMPPELISTMNFFKFFPSVIPAIQPVTLLRVKSQKYQDNLKYLENTCPRATLSITTLHEITWN
jgi:hypothetical protein